MKQIVLIIVSLIALCGCKGYVQGDGFVVVPQNTTNVVKCKKVEIERTRRTKRGTKTTYTEGKDCKVCNQHSCWWERRD